MERITPSKQANPWAHGNPDGLTQAQERAVRALPAYQDDRRRRAGMPPFYPVTRLLEQRPGEWMGRSITFQCPTVVASRERTRICVIAPDGSQQWVDWK